MEDLPPVVLASESPRRQMLLRELIPEFKVSPADIDETFLPGESPFEAAGRLASLKANVVSKKFPDSIVIAGDTVVTIETEMLAKPVDDEEAVSMLRALSGRTHQVITALAIQRGHHRVGGVASTIVTFRELSGSEIRAYVATGEPRDKAGAYAIQGGAAGFVANLEGPIDTVIGFPRDLCRQLLEQLKAKKKADYEL